MFSLPVVGRNIRSLGHDSLFNPNWRAVNGWGLEYQGADLHRWIAQLIDKNLIVRQRVQQTAYSQAALYV